jgi:hypothetical protein
MATVRQTHRARTAEMQRVRPLRHSRGVEPGCRGCYVVKRCWNAIRRKLPRLVWSGPVWTPYLTYCERVTRVLLYRRRMAPPFPGLIETGGKTDTQSPAHARCMPGETLQSARNFLILSRRVAGVHNLHSAIGGQEIKKTGTQEATQGTKGRFRALVGDHYPKSRASHAPFPRYSRSTDPFWYRSRRTEPKPSGRAWAPEQRNQSLRFVQPPDDRASCWP